MIVAENETSATVQKDNFTKQDKLRDSDASSQEDEVEQVEGSMAFIPDPPPLSMWRICGLISLLMCIPYTCMIEKTPANMVRVTLLSLDCLVRLWFPASYIPNVKATPTLIGSPYFARLLATLAEPVVLEA